MITNEQYHADTSRISKSGLDEISQSPRHYWAKYLDPNREKETPTAALLFGSALHTAILEPIEFARKYVVAPEINRRTNAGKAEWDALLSDCYRNNQTLIDAEDRREIVRLKEAVYAHPSAALLLKHGRPEQTFAFREPITGAPCKMRPDWLDDTHGFIVDIKTTDDASPTGFAKSVWTYRYDVQAAFYLDGLAQLEGAMRPGFIFIAVEKKRPYNVGVYVATEEVINMGRKRYLPDLEKYVECRQYNTWPGYSNEVQALQLPAWAK